MSTILSASYQPTHLVFTATLGGVPLLSLLWMGNRAERTAGLAKNEIWTWLWLQQQILIPNLTSEKHVAWLSQSGPQATVIGSGTGMWTQLANQSQPHYFGRKLWDKGAPLHLSYMNVVPCGHKAHRSHLGSCHRERCQYNSGVKNVKTPLHSKWS